MAWLPVIAFSVAFLHSVEMAVISAIALSPLWGISAFVAAIGGSGPVRSP